MAFLTASASLTSALNTATWRGLLDSRRISPRACSRFTRFRARREILAAPEAAACLATARPMPLEPPVMNTWRPLMGIDGERRRRRRKKTTATGNMELARRSTFALSMSGETERLWRKVEKENRRERDAGES